MALTDVQTSFAAGELSQNLYARVDLEKFQSGAALLRNFFVDYRGGATTRAGTQFLARTKAPGTQTPRLISFIFSTTQAYVIEMGDQYFRFYANGAQVTEPTTAITGVTQASPAVVHDVAHGYTSGDEVFITAVLGMTQLNGRNFLITVIDVDHYSLQTLSGANVNSATYGAYTSGGTAARIYTLATPYVWTDLPLLKFVQSADVMTFTHPSYAPRNLTRVTASAFSLTALVVGPAQASPTTLTATFRGASAANRVNAYVVTAVSRDGKEESVPTTPPTILLASTLTQDNIGKLGWTAPSAPVAHYNIYATNQTREDVPIGTVFGYIGQSLSTAFTDNGIAPDYSKVPPQFADPFSGGQVKSIAVTAGGSYTGQFIVALTITGGGGTDAAAYAITDGNSAAQPILSVVITNPGKNYTSAPTVTPASGAATFTATVTDAAPTYPACDAYYQQRRVYGNLVGSPEKLVASQIANYDNFDTTPLSLDTDAITMTLTSRQVNDIKAMVPMQTGLVVLTGGGAFLVSGGSANGPFTPSTASAFPQASSGVNDMPPIVVNYDILSVSARGTSIRDLAFNFYSQSYNGSDRTQLASHLFYGQTLREWCYAEEPHKLIWVVRADGALLSMAYVPEQEVYAWSRHDTLGSFLSVTTIPEGSANAVYLIVSRTINGEVVNYVERFAPRIIADVQHAWTVDAGLRYDGPPVATVSGLDHLVGATVTGLADGTVITPVVVGADGSVDLPLEASIATIGLAFSCQLQSLYFDTSAGGDTVQSKRKKVNAVNVFYSQASGLRAGIDFTTMYEIKDLQVSYTPPISLKDGFYRVALAPAWTVEGQVCLDLPYPLPATILGLVAEVTIGDTAR